MIKAEKIDMIYKKNKVRVLKEVSFTIEKGEVVALLGHNGCGKSTLIKCLTGILKPTSGKAYINGLDSFKYQKKIRNEIGVVFNQKPSFIVDLEVMDNLLYFKAIYNISDDQFTKMLEMVDGFLGISSLYKKPYRKLSFGERVKCEIASVILHNPAYLIFDEPTIGLDYKAKLGFYNMIKFLNKEYKTTILLITHEIDHIQDTCNRIIMMSEGNIKYDGSMAKIMEGRKIGCSLTVNYIEQMDELLFETLKKEAQTVDENKHIMKFICSGEEERQNVVERVVKGLKFSEIKTEISSFKEVFADVLQKDA